MRLSAQDVHWAFQFNANGRRSNGLSTFCHHYHHCTKTLTGGGWFAWWICLALQRLFCVPMHTVPCHTKAERLCNVQAAGPPPGIEFRARSDGLRRATERLLVPQRHQFQQLMAGKGFEFAVVPVALRGTLCNILGGFMALVGPIVEQIDDCSGFDLVGVPRVLQSVCSCVDIANGGVLSREAIRKLEVKIVHVHGRTNSGSRWWYRPTLGTAVQGRHPRHP